MVVFMLYGCSFAKNRGRGFGTLEVAELVVVFVFCRFLDALFHTVVVVVCIHAFSCHASVVFELVLA